MAAPLFNPTAVQIAQLATQCPVVSAAVVSKTLVDVGPVKLVLFSMDAGQELSEHRAPLLAMVHVLDGCLRVSARQRTHVLERDGWVLLPANEPHAVLAEAPSRFLLTLAKELSE